MSRFKIGLVMLALGVGLVSSASAQVYFGRQVSGQGGPVTGLFRVDNGAVSAVATGLASHDFPALSANGLAILMGSPDPAQPFEASTDLFVHSFVTGTTRRLVNNRTFEYPNGYHRFASPMFSGLSVDNQLVAYVNQVASSGTRPQNPDPNDPYPFGSEHFRMLSVIRASDGGIVSLAEIGSGSALDYYASEFVGLSWWPFGPFFVTPAYVPVVTNLGRHAWAAGLVMFGPDATGQFVRVAQLTQPQVFEEYGVRIVTETHAWPAFSPDGRRIAFFRTTYPSAVMAEPATTELVVMNTDGSGQPTTLVGYQPGVLPTGLSWAANNRTLVYSVGFQAQENGFFPPTADPSTSAIFTIDSLVGGQPGTIPGTTLGYVPNAMPALIFRGGFE